MKGMVWCVLFVLFSSVVFAQNDNDLLNAVKAKLDKVRD